MTISTGSAPSGTLAARLRHVRWLAGGTGSGKSTAAAILAERFGCEVYSGDRAESDWLTRCSAREQPRLAAARGQRPGDSWRGRSPEQAFAAMAGRYGETIGFLVEDLLARPDDRIVVVDYFGVLPRELAPLLSGPTQAVFLVPTPALRRTALTHRYSDPDRARANWGDLDPAVVLELRLARDALWDAEVAGQARTFALPLLTVTDSLTPAAVAARLAEWFGLSPQLLR